MITKLLLLILCIFFVWGFMDIGKGFDRDKQKNAESIQQCKNLGGVLIYRWNSDFLDDCRFPLKEKE